MSPGSRFPEFRKIEKPLTMQLIFLICFHGNRVAAKTALLHTYFVCQYVFFDDQLMKKVW